ncbi:MAG: hypothetical protein EOP38_01660 [Rubrivivax sp.]|nr:MAG: hypothetical protein EOP38_01660 [Rubrivivax sp.]
MDKFWEEFSKYIKERFSSPFLSSFVISLLVVNYKTLFVLFSSEKYEDKFKYIDKTIYATSCQTALLLLAFPLGTAIFYTFIWPWFDKKLSVHAERQANAKAGEILAIQNKRPIDSELQDKIFAEHKKITDDFKSRLAANHGRESSLEKQLNNTRGRYAERLRRQTLLRIADPAEMTTDQLVSLLNSQNYTLPPDQYTKFLDYIKLNRALQLTSKFIKLTEKIPYSQDYRKTLSVGWIGSALNISAEEANDLFEVLAALEIVHELPDPDGAFDVSSDAQSRYQNITALINDV